MRCLLCNRDDISSQTEVCPGCGVHLPSLLRDVLPEGTLLHDGKYRIDYALGRGGFGITYLAQHVTLEQQVAVKEFYPQEAVRNGQSANVTVSTVQKGSYDRALQRFVREGRMLAMLNHPNVVRVRDHFEERGTAYLVMDYISPARTLREELDAQTEKRLPVDRVRKITEQLVEALEAVHQKNVFHLDIKPANVLITPTGQTILVDFGAARHGLGSSKSTQAYTPEYAAPEVLAGADVGPQTDLYELGVMLHEMLTGKIPPTAIARLTNDRWTTEHLQEPWRTLVASALRLERETRPVSVRAWWESQTAAHVPTVINQPVQQQGQQTRSQQISDSQQLSNSQQPPVSQQNAQQWSSQERSSQQQQGSQPTNSQQQGPSWSNQQPVPVVPLQNPSQQNPSQQRPSQPHGLAQTQRVGPPPPYAPTPSQPHAPNAYAPAHNAYAPSSKSSGKGYYVFIAAVVFGVVALLGLGVYAYLTSESGGKSSGPSVVTNPTPASNVSATPAPTAAPTPSQANAQSPARATNPIRGTWMIGFFYENVRHDVILRMDEYAGNARVLLTAEDGERLAIDQSMSVNYRSGGEVYAIGSNPTISGTGQAAEYVADTFRFVPAGGGFAVYAREPTGEFMPVLTAQRVSPDPNYNP